MQRDMESPAGSDRLNIEALPPPRMLLDGTRLWPGEVIFGGAREVAIEHEGGIYRLRRTSKGKLILTK